MATKRDIKRRINSVINTQKITNAMKLVATARFSKLNALLHNVRIYDENINKIVKCAFESVYNEVNHPLYVPEETSNKIAVIVVSTDRGLCGAINNNLFKYITNWLNQIKDIQNEVDFLCIGRKAIQFFKKANYHVIENYEKVLEKLSLKNVEELVFKIKNLFLEQKYKKIYLAYSHFISAIQQRPTIIQLLPVHMDESVSLPENYNNMIIIEPPLHEMLDDLLIKQVTFKFFRVLFEAATSEQGSRMTAMDNATNNAEELRHKLVLQYNKVRQATITKELIEITTGAQVR